MPYGTPKPSNLPARLLHVEFDFGILTSYFYLGWPGAAGAEPTLSREGFAQTRFQQILSECCEGPNKGDKEEKKEERREQRRRKRR